MLKPGTLSIDDRLLRFLDESGLTEIVGGADKLQEAFDQLRGALLRVAADMLVAVQREVPISIAVLDPIGFPHLASLHGSITDVLIMEIPTDIRPWVERIIDAAPASDAPEVRGWLLQVAREGRDPGHRMLARLALFEGLCMNGRLLLRSAGEHLEALNGRSNDIERIAEVEMRALLADETYWGHLAELKDPWQVMLAASAVSLARHQKELREEVLLLDDELRGELNLRRKMLEALELMPPADAVLVRNHFAAELGEEQVTVDHLQVLHPDLLGGIKRNTLDQRLKRLLGRGHRLFDTKRAQTASFSDLILDSQQEIQA